MPKLELKIHHLLPKLVALSRIKKFLPELKAKHYDKISDLEETWSGNSCIFKFNVSGINISGSVIVEDSEVIISGDLPILAMFFKSQIENTIRQQAEKLLK